MATTTILKGGEVLTSDPASPSAEALAIRNGRILAVGDLAEVEAQAGRRADRIDLDGAVVIPGLIDTHPHLMHFGLFEAMCEDLSDAANHADIVARLRRRAAKTRRGGWVLGSPIGEPHYFLDRTWRDLEEGALPDRAVLDQVSRRLPVLIMAFAPTTPNHIAMNSAALAALGLTAETPERVGNVWIEKDDEGHPTGRLSGSVNNYYNNEPFWDGLLAKIPLPGPVGALSATLKAQQAYHAMGVTTVYEGHAMTAEQIAGYRILRRSGLLSMRVLCSPEAEPYGTPWDQDLSDDEFAAALEAASAMVRRDDDLLRVDGVTIGRGGPCGPGFLLMRDPYAGPYGEQTTGVSFMSKERAERAIDYCARRGLRLNIVSAGTQEHDDYLDYLESLDLKPFDAADRAWILQHLYFVEEAQAQRMAAFGFDVTTSISFSWGKGDLFRERIGPQCLGDLIPIKRLMSSGMHVACGSDWGPKNIFKQMALAVEPVFAQSGDSNAGPAQVISREESFASWTREAAHVLRWDGVGALRPGFHADLAILDRNPVTAPLDALEDAKVYATISSGRCVHGEPYLREKGWRARRPMIQRLFRPAV